MAKSLTLFIKAKWTVKPFSSKSTVWVWGGWAPEHKFEKLISKEDTLALKVTREVAEERGLKIKVYDLANIKGWMFAQIKKVKVTPTIIINNHRIEGVPSKDELLAIR
jgi:hypothetical protein